VDKPTDWCVETLLPQETVEQVLRRQGIKFRDCLYTPLVTIWTFLYQVLSADHSCRAAVAQLLAFLSLAGESGSAKTDPYCKARDRLPEALCAELARESGQELHKRVGVWGPILKGRPVKIVDGTTGSMPDTAENQKEYPQQSAQKPGLGFPILRWVALISLSCGAVLDVAMGPYAGKRTGETALLRQLLGGLRAGDVLLGDACYSNYWMIALVLERGVDVVMYHDGKRRIDFRTGKRLGRDDHVVSWEKPKRPQWMDQSCYDRLPAQLSIREVRVEVSQRGFRTRRLILVTTLLDAVEYPREDLAAAYRARWNAELDLRSIKQVMQMDVLRCKTPARVRKEIWMHMLAYNLVRKLMAEAAAANNLCPRDISFKGTLQTLNSFAACGWSCSAKTWRQLYGAILRAVATHRVRDRPDRVEPRAIKRRPKEQTLLTEPRQAARKRLLERR
jgi:hypothetical protein